MVGLPGAADAPSEGIDEPSLFVRRIVAGESERERLRHRSIHFPAIHRIVVGVQTHVESLGTDLHGEEGRRIGAVPRPVTHALHVPRQVVGELARFGNPRRGVHVVAVVHGTQRLAKQCGEDLVEVLGIAPGREGGVFAKRPLRNRLLGSHGALRIDDRDCGEPDAREQNDQRNAKAKRRGQRQPAEEGWEHGAIMGSENGGDNGLSV